MVLDFVAVHKKAKKEVGLYPAILTSRSVNNTYIILVFPGEKKSYDCCDPHSYDIVRHLNSYPLVDQPAGDRLERSQPKVFILPTRIEGSEM